MPATLNMKITISIEVVVVGIETWIGVVKEETIEAPLTIEGGGCESQLLSSPPKNNLKRKTYRNTFLNFP